MTPLNKCSLGDSCGYKVPDDYNPDLNNENVDKDEATKIRQNCLAIMRKHVYYVGSDNQLHGYRWINFPMRLFLTFKNLITRGKTEKRAAKKIAETFDKILRINTAKSIIGTRELLFFNRQMVNN